MLNISDIVALAKQGYKPQDVKDLMTLANEQSNSDVSETVAVAPDNAAGDEDNKPIDYEALYKSALTEIEALKANIQTVSDDLKTAQKENTNKDVSDENNTLETSKQIWENFIKAR